MKMTIALMDDWQVVYVDGRLVMQDHCIEAFDAVEVAIEKGVTSIERKWIDENWFYDENGGDMPEDEGSVKFVTDA